MPREYKNYINGEWVPASDGALTPDQNPANPDHVLGLFPLATREDARRAIDAAHAAFPAWRRTPAPARGAILHKAAGILEARVEEVARALTEEEGKTIAESRAETTRGAHILRYVSGLAWDEVGEVFSASTPGTLLYTTRVPLGVVGLITPWNFPVAIPIWKLAPALLYGNTVVMKPANLTPLTAYLITECLAQAGIPKGVFNLINGKGSVVGEELASNPKVRGISFTGSNPVGRDIYHKVSLRGARVQLEMGGKNPVVVADDANLDQAAELTVAGAMWSTGQKCTATSRAYVARKVLGDFTDAVVTRCKALKVGDPMDPQTQVGPLVSADQEKSVLGYVEVGRSEGAKLAAGGGKPKGLAGTKGFYVEPTVFSGVTNQMRIGREEIFGPVLGIIPVEDLKQGIELANDSDFGLSASLFTRDLKAAMQYLSDIEVGLVHVNSQTAGAEPHVPFGGFKSSSSFSREQGKEAKNFFTQIQTVYLDPPR